MEGSTNLSIVLHGGPPLTHPATCVLLTRDGKTLATGSETGQLWLWDVSVADESGGADSVKPRAVLHSPQHHTPAISALAEASCGQDLLNNTPPTILVSAAADGSVNRPTTYAASPPFFKIVPSSL